MNTNDNLPELSHLQFAVLDVLGTAQMSGKDLRTGLGELGINKSGPAFYQMMARMEDAKLVDGSYTQQVIDGQIIKQRQYKITGNGIRALNDTKQFYHGRTEVMALNPAFA